MIIVYQLVFVLFLLVILLCRCTFCMTCLEFPTSFDCE
ncbi:hypothetical protein LINGRAHAP2_LOCUS28168 [Linum grandiflorum]